MQCRKFTCVNVTTDFVTVWENCPAHRSRYKFSNFPFKGWILLLAQRQVFLWSDSLTETHIWLTVVCHSFFRVKGVFYGKRRWVGSQLSRLHGCFSPGQPRRSARLTGSRSACWALTAAQMLKRYMPSRVDILNVSTCYCCILKWYWHSFIASVWQCREQWL